MNTDPEVSLLRAVSYNLGCGGPYGATRVEAAHRWRAAARDQYDILFLQEVPPDPWLRDWSPTHHVESVTSQRARVRSALVVGSAMTCSPVHFATASYHDTYVAAATVTFPGGREVVCMSVHASPSVVTPDWRGRWARCGTSLPAARDGEDLWDSDLLLASVQALSKRGSLLVAGDWNEARSWDTGHPGTSGAQFFERVEKANLIDCTWKAWGNCERDTCTPDRGAAMQLDHVFATPDVASSIREPRIDVDALGIGGSDHYPINFSIQFDATT